MIRDGRRFATRIGVLAAAVLAALAVPGTAHANHDLAVTASGSSAAGLGPTACSVDAAIRLTEASVDSAPPGTRGVVIGTAVSECAAVTASVDVTRYTITIYQSIAGLGTTEIGRTNCTLGGGAVRTCSTPEIAYSGGPSTLRAWVNIDWTSTTSWVTATPSYCTFPSATVAYCQAGADIIG